MLPAKFGSIWPSIFRGEDFLTLANQKQELPLAAIFAGGMVVVVMLVYGSWIYNYLCNQCLSALKLRVRIPLMVRCTRYNFM